MSARLVLSCSASASGFRRQLFRAIWDPVNHYQGSKGSTINYHALGHKLLELSGELSLVRYYYSNAANVDKSSG